ncbi:MAG: DUF1428 domain-containing protein [Pyrinomonadaceae bacterium]|nr:DUF1428 domain-containing protein [Pyrinomonadaceae bacterium]
MGKYVDGFLLPVKEENIEKYAEIARKAGEIWKEYGALEYIEAAGDDLDHDNMYSFRKSAGTTDSETVVFSFIVFESKEERDRINALVMEDERLKEMMKSGGDQAFDFKRMAYGGFKAIVEF